jgi:alpha-D-ribose 1-methylphosphonate 5-triphosphate synthase subunit PhnG
MKPGNHSQETTDRQKWIRVLAKSSPDELEKTWQQLTHKPKYSFLRSPEVGLIMVRARAGGTGRSFNLGEMTLTRCTVQLESGEVGHGYVAGRVSRQAELVAVFDAMLQDLTKQRGLLEDVINPLAASQEQRRRLAELKTTATKVDFFTMVRGDE